MPDFTAPTPEMIVVLPELLLVAAVFLILLVDPFTGRDRTAVVAIALSGLLASGVAAVALSGQEIVSFGGMVALDGYAVFFKVLFAAAGVLTVIMSPKYLEAHGRHIGEYYALSVLTMATGTLMALVQKNVKRMLAYSSIAHVGYLLAGLAAMGRAGDSEAGQSVLLYLAAYTFMNLGAFGILAYLKSCNAADFDYSLESMAGLGRRSAPAAILMTLFMFSLTGMPGTAGFIGKFYLFTAVVRADLTWLAVIAVLFSAVSAYYYLRIIVYMFFRETDRELSAEGTPVGAMAAALWASAVCVVLIGLFPSAIWDAAVHALTGFAL